MNRRVTWKHRWTPVLLANALSFAAAAAPPPSPGQAPEQTPEQIIVDQYCVGCHNTSAKTAGLTLDLIGRQEVTQHPEVWEKVVRRLRARQMPPAGLPRPGEPAYEAVLASLESKLDAAATSHPNPGRTDTFRRLNRTEYKNVIRDLLALDIDVAALLPSDESSHGFDNVTVGELSPTLLDRYISAARKSAGSPWDARPGLPAAIQSASHPT